MEVIGHLRSLHSTDLHIIIVTCLVGLLWAMETGDGQNLLKVFFFVQH